MTLTEPIHDLTSQAPSAHAPEPNRRCLLDPGLDLTLRPMRYPHFYERYKDAIRNTWTVEEVDLSDDLTDLHRRLLPSEKHLVKRLVAFFATGDSIVANNLVLNLYAHVNAPEARLYLSRQLYEEALHVQFYLTLLDTYLDDDAERAEAFAAIENVPSIRAKGEFCFRWIDSLGDLDRLETEEHRRAFVLNLVCFAACIEGLFFFAAFSYVYFLRSKGLLNGLAAGTNWVFRDESMHMSFAFDVLDTIRSEQRRAWFVGGRHPPVPPIRGRSAPCSARTSPSIRVVEPVRVHGTPGCVGARQLLRANRVGLSSRCRRHGGIRRGVLNSAPGHVRGARQARKR